MTWYAVYETATGALKSVGTVVADPLPAGLSALALSTQPAGQVWNASTLAFETPVARTILTPYQFVNLFTPTEMAGILAAATTNAAVNLYIEMLHFAQEVDLSDPNTVSGVNALAAAGLITAARAAQILANQ